MNDLLSIAKQILEANPAASLTGSLMLKLRGIDLGREPSDIDILIYKDYAFNLVIPEGMDFKESEFASDGCGIKYDFNGIKIDVMSSGEEPEIVDGINLASVKELIKMKYTFANQDGPKADKHKNDLIKMGYDFPEIKSCDLPY
jgi:hypothetical protein